MFSTNHFPTRASLCMCQFASFPTNGNGRTLHTKNKNSTRVGKVVNWILNEILATTFRSKLYDGCIQNARMDEVKQNSIVDRIDSHKPARPLSELGTWLYHTNADEKHFPCNNLFAYIRMSINPSCRFGRILPVGHKYM